MYYCYSKEKSGGKWRHFRSLAFQWRYFRWCNFRLYFENQESVFVCFGNLITVLYFMQYSHCYCCLCHVNRIHTCNTINILIGHQLFNDDFLFYKWWEMFYSLVSDDNGEMYQRSYSVINRRSSLVDDQQLVKFIIIFQPGSRLVRQFIFNLQLL